MNLPGTGTPGSNTPASPSNGQATWTVGREGNPQDWTLLNQTWTVKIIPAVTNNLLTILQTPPPANGNQGTAPQVPTLNNVSVQDWNLLNTH